jgi:hypothetical protein
MLAMTIAIPVSSDIFLAGMCRTRGRDLGYPGRMWSRAVAKIRKYGHES